MGQGRRNECNDSVSESTITVWWERDVTSRPKRDPCDEEWKWGTWMLSAPTDVQWVGRGVYGFKACGREKRCMGISMRIGVRGRGKWERVHNRRVGWLCTCRQE